MRSAGRRGGPARWRCPARCRTPTPCAAGSTRPPPSPVRLRAQSGLIARTRRRNIRPAGIPGAACPRNGGRLPARSTRGRRDVYRRSMHRRPGCAVAVALGGVRPTLPGGRSHTTLPGKTAKAGRPQAGGHPERPRAGRYSAASSASTTGPRKELSEPAVQADHDIFGVAQASDQRRRLFRQAQGCTRNLNISNAG